jgi:hypothetical protein
MRERVQRHPEAMRLRRETAEHPFANLKHRILGNGRLLLRGMKGAGTEVALAVLAYNFRRALNLLGTDAPKVDYPACLVRPRPHFPDVG